MYNVSQSGSQSRAKENRSRGELIWLIFGLKDALTGQSEAEEELRSRVYWNCYVLDKTLAEETGRSFLLPYRRSSTPFPSLTETDEFESWPPLSMTSAPLPRSVRHIVPRRGYVLSCFVWTCRLGMIVEDILDLDVIGPPISDPYDQQFASNNKGREKVKDAEEIAEQLRVWKASLPKYLDVNPSGPVSPLPHHVIGMTVSRPLWDRTSAEGRSGGGPLVYCYTLALSRDGL